MPPALRGLPEKKIKREEETQMRKKLLSLALTLALCLGLAIPAFAAERPKDAAEAFANVTLTYPLDSEHQGGFGEGLGVEESWTMWYEDYFEEIEKVTETVDGYWVIRENTEFTLSCSGPADTTYVRVYVTLYANDGSGEYEWANWPHSLYLTNSGNFLSDECDPEEDGGLVELTGGQSVKFTLPEMDGDVIYELRIEKYYPDFATEETDEWGDTSMVMPYWYRYMYLKVDGAAVDQQLKELETAEPEQPTDPVEPEQPTDPVDPVEPTDPAADFSDVSDGDYFANPVRWAVANNITSGMGDGSFGAANTCSRAQILTFLYAAAGRPEPTAENPFADVQDTDYFYKPALWAAEKGLVSGDTFAAETPCTRASTMDYLWKSAGSPEAAYDGRFDDVAADADYAQAVAWAVENGVTAGVGEGAFGSEATCTRGQIMTFLYVVYGK